MSNDKFEYVPIGKLFPSPTNPRKKFDQAQLSELAESIKSHGIIQPLVVRFTVNGLEIVAGERRFRAAQMAKVAEVPVINRILTDKQVIEIQVIENAQRADVHPLEESEAFGRMIQIGYDAEGIAAKIGKPRAYVLQRLSLSKLSPTSREWFEEGYLLIGHALILARFDADEQDTILKETCYHWGTDKMKDSPPSILEFNREANRKESSLAKAIWDLADPTLHERGACTSCAFNTSYGLLAGMEDDDPQCLKRICFDAKQEAYKDREIAKTQEAEPKAKQIVGRDVSAWEVEISAEPKAGYAPAVWAQMYHHSYDFKVGELVYIKKTSSRSASFEREQQAKKEAAEKKTAENKAIYAAALSELPRIETSSENFRAVLAHLVLGISSSHMSHTTFKKLGEDDKAREAALLDLSIPQLIELWAKWTMDRAVKVEYYYDNSARLRSFARAVGIDIEHVVRELDVYFESFGPGSPHYSKASIDYVCNEVERRLVKGSEE